MTTTRTTREGGKATNDGKATTREKARPSFRTRLPKTATATRVLRVPPRCLLPERGILMLPRAPPRARREARAACGARSAAAHRARRRRRRPRRVVFINPFADQSLCVRVLPMVPAATTLRGRDVRVTGGRGALDDILEAAGRASSGERDPGGRSRARRRAGVRARRPIQRGVDGAARRTGPRRAYSKSGRAGERAARGRLVSRTSRATTSPRWSCATLRARRRRRRRRRRRWRSAREVFAALADCVRQWHQQFADGPYGARYETRRA